MTQKFEAKCPHPDCAAILRIRASTPDGEYECICRSQRVKLTWITSLIDGRYPWLRLADEPQEDTSP